MECNEGGGGMRWDAVVIGHSFFEAGGEMV
jgi:hypothetical protein